MQDDQMVDVLIQIPQAVVEDMCFMMVPEFGEVDEEQTITKFASLAFLIISMIGSPALSAKGR